MSLETLLEAAEFIDCERDKNGRTRVKHSDDFHLYAKANSENEGKDGGSQRASFNQRKSRQRHTSATSTSSAEGDFGPNSRASIISTGNRDLHNRLEKNRRAQLKQCFEQLKSVIPAFDDDRKASNLMILKSAARHIQALRRQETELEMEMQRYARQKIMNQERINLMKHELGDMNVEVDVSNFYTIEETEDVQSTTSTATADNDEPILSDDDEQSSSTLSATSTPGGDSPTQKSIYSTPVSNSFNSNGMFKVPTAASPQKSTKPPVTMHSILNRTLLGASTNVLSILTSTSPTATSSTTSPSIRPVSLIPNTHLLPQAEAQHKMNKSVVTQILQQQLQQRLRASLKAQAEKKQEAKVKSVLQQSLGGSSASGGGTIITYGPATVTKLVPETQANCDITSGIQLSSLEKEHLENFGLAALGGSGGSSGVTKQALHSPGKSYSVSSSPSNWSNPVSIIDGQNQLSPTKKGSQQAKLNRLLLNSGSSAVPLQLQQINSSTVKSTTAAAASSSVLKVKPETQSVAVTTVTLPVTANSISLSQQTNTVFTLQTSGAQLVSNSNNLGTVYTLKSPQLELANVAGGGVTTLQKLTAATSGSSAISSNSKGSSAGSSSGTSAPPPILQAQLITPAQLQQLLLQSSFQDQHFKHSDTGSNSSSLLSVSSLSSPSPLTSPQKLVLQQSANNLIQQSPQKLRLLSTDGSSSSLSLSASNSSGNSTPVLCIDGTPDTVSKTLLKQDTSSTVEVTQQKLGLTPVSIASSLSSKATNLSAGTSVLHTTVAGSSGSTGNIVTVNNTNPVSLTQLPLAQIIQPVTMVPPQTVHLTHHAPPSSLHLSPEVLKSLGLGQMSILQQAVPVKPQLVMVTVPNVVVASNSQASNVVTSVTSSSQLNI